MSQTHGNIVRIGQATAAPHDAGSGPAAGRFGAPRLVNSDTTRRRVALPCGQTLDAPVLLVCRDDEHFANQTGWLRARGIEVTTTGRIYQIIHALAQGRAQASVLLIHIDAFGGTSANLGVLRYLRENLPALPVALISRHFRQDESRPQDLGLCDGALRMPLTPEALDRGLAQTLRCNAIWQVRHWEVHCTDLGD